MFRAFEVEKLEDVIKIILEQGELQISELERKEQYDGTEKEIAQIISEKCISTATGKPVPVTVLPIQIILKAMEEIHFRIQPDQSAKKQALHAIKALKTKLSLTRMKMRIRLAYNQEDSAEIETILGEHTEESMQVEGERKVSVCLIDPDVYRKLNKLIGQPSEGKEERVRVEIVDASVADFPLPAQENFVTPAGPRKISGEEGKQEEVKVVVKPVVREEPPGAKKFGCTTCPGANFSGPGDQRYHFKSDWHKVNVKLKVAARPLLSEAEFQIIEPRELEYWMTLKNL